jgi:hypothetical protein
VVAPNESSTPAEHDGRSVAAWIALGALMLIASALILYMGRGLTFFRDEWTFVVYRDGHDPVNFLSSYAGHLLLWPTAFFVFMFHAVGLDHYDLYRLAALPWHLACALLVYLLARRRVGDLVALAPAGALLFLGSAWMDILWPFQIAFTGAIAFGLAAVLVLDRDDLPGDGLACLCLLIAVGWSGASLPFLPGVAAGLLVRRRLWRRIWVVAAPAVVYLLWLAKYGDQQIDYAKSLLHAPDYILKMAGAGITGLTGLPAVAGPYLALTLGLLVAIRLWRLGRSSSLAWEALAMAASFWVLTALARGTEHDPTAVRYVYSSAVFLLLLAVGLAPAGAPRRAVAFAVIGLAALTIPSNIEGFEAGRDDLRFSSNISSAELGAVQLARGTVSPEYAPELNGFPNAVPAASFFAVTDRYGSSPADSPDEIAASPDYARRRADATSLAALRVHPQGAPRDLGLTRRPARFPSVAGGAFSLPGGCLVLGGTGHVDAEGIVPQAGLLIGSASTRVTLALRRFAQGFHPLPQGVPPASRRLLRIAPDAERLRPWRVRILAHHGPVTVCRVVAGNLRRPYGRNSG